MGANHNYFNTEWTPGQAAAPAEDDFTYERPVDLQSLIDVLQHSPGLAQVALLRDAFYEKERETVARLEELDDNQWLRSGARIESFW